MTREEAIDVFNYEVQETISFCSDSRHMDDRSKKFLEACGAAIELLKAKPCDDAISRKAVENITWEEPTYTDALNVLTEVRDKVRALPPVTPKQKTEYWIEDWEMGLSECPVCHATYLWEDFKGVGSWHHCPNCGKPLEVRR